MKPYVIRPYEPGAAYVDDRATGTRAGWVLQDHRGNWEAIVHNRVVGYYHWRAAAAEAVWEGRA